MHTIVVLVEILHTEAQVEINLFSRITLFTLTLTNVVKNLGLTFSKYKIPQIICLKCKQRNFYFVPVVLLTSYASQAYIMRVELRISLISYNLHFHRSSHKAK